MSKLALPQCLLGFEAQLSAFAAAFPELSPRMAFVRFPAAFAHPASLAALAPWLEVGQGGPPVHLGFGGPRVSQVMKVALNGAVIAEQPRVSPVTTSQHPFADGFTLPTAVRRVFVYAPGGPDYQTFTGKAIQQTTLPASCVTADIDAAKRRPKLPADGHAGLDLVSFAEYRSNQWVAGRVRTHSAHMRDAMTLAVTDGTPFLLMPWNLDDPGSVVPELLLRIVRLHRTGQRPAVRPLVLPFNYPGQLGLVRHLIACVRNAAAEPEDMLRSLFIARLTRLADLPLLLRLASIAWVDGNDPEHKWTLQRLGACGIETILLDPGYGTDPATRRVHADEPIWVEADTRWGGLRLKSAIPSLRKLSELLAATDDLRAALSEGCRDMSWREKQRA